MDPPVRRAPRGRPHDSAVDNVLGAILGIVLLVASIAMFPIGFALQDSIGGPSLAICFVIGIVLLSACLPVPVFLLERFEGARAPKR